MSFYSTQKRDIPWRAKKRDPYSVWISEVMSQQSQMERVVAFYLRWMKQFPTIVDLASASEDEVLKAWEGLGYYSRARNILLSAQILVTLGAPEEWPKSSVEWKLLPGIGDYTAKAIMSFAFHSAELPLDGNVLRVFSRYFGIEDPLNNSTERKKVEELLNQYEKDSSLKHGAFAEALMDHGATLCLPATRVLCEGCPVASSCFAFSNKLAPQYPKAKKRKETEKLTTLSLVYRNKEMELLFRKRPETSLQLAGQWELPSLNLPGHEINPLEAFKGNDFGIQEGENHRITNYFYKNYIVEAGQWVGALPADHCFSSVSEASKKLNLTTLTRKNLFFC